MSQQQEWRDQLADTIKRRWVLRGDARAGDFADELMPTVRAIVAGELRAAADWLWDDNGEAAAAYHYLCDRACDLVCDNCGGDPDTCDCDES